MSKGKQKQAGAGGMIFLAPEHPIIKDLVYNSLNSYINDEPKQGNPRMIEPMDLKVADFDGVVYKVETPQGTKSVLRISLFMNGYNSVKSAGAEAELRANYSDFLTSPADGADATFDIDASRITNAQVQEVANKFGLLKRNVLAAPLKTAFDALLGGNPSSVRPCVIQIRDSEQMVISPSKDRVNVAVSIAMPEPADRVFAEQILDTMARASRSSNGPNINFTKDVPAEVARIGGIIRANTAVGFLLFSITKSHVGKGNMDAVVDLLLTVRHYIHYHIKASKAYLHQKMRKKTAYFQQVLNRAAPEKKKLVKKFKVINY